MRLFWYRRGAAATQRIPRPTDGRARSATTIRARRVHGFNRHFPSNWRFMPDADDPGASPSKKSAGPLPTLPHDVLVIDDEVLLTMDIEEILHHLGVASVRCAATVAQAMRAIDERTPDFVLLDVTLGIETSFGIARRLQTLGVRFAFVTGYGDDVAFAGEFAEAPKIRKPYTAEILRAALS